ncbi:DNA N6-methyl adenine demethylase isoform X2 [Drosophila guanche]|nr:DNA N6-methyl adenine demethylase isoform X2 [Drosophila guanche]SPP87982.1 blast:Protein PML [Drosophila guanche]
MWIPSGCGRWSLWLLPLAFAACLLPFTHATAPQGPAGPIPDNGKRHSRGNSSGLLADSQLSASERSRRLIPYMAFYLPAPELPINQQYAAKHSASAGGAQLQAPSVGRIPVPLAYMPQQQQQQQHQKQQLLHPHHHASNYQSGAGEVYHTLAIGSHQHPHGHGHAHAHGHPPHPPPGQGKEHLTDSGATFIAYKPLNPTYKHKTVQHFPPLPAQKEQQLQYPPQYELVSPQYHQRQRAKQSKINLTPFTAQNTLPGQFVPIIYTPVSSDDQQQQQQQQHNGNTINYNNNKPEIVYEDATSPHKNSHQTQIVADYAAAVASAEQPSQSAEEQHQQQPEEEQQPPPPSIGYGVYSEAAGTSTADVAGGDAAAGAGSGSGPVQSSLPATKTALIIHQKSNAYGGHVSKYESYFNMAPPSPAPSHPNQHHPNHHQHHPHQSQGHMTPQEKYVLYLQQRMKHQKHQQHQQQLQQQQQKQQQQQHYDFPHPARPAQSNTLAGKPHPPQHTPHQHPNQLTHTQTQSQSQSQSPHKYDAPYVRPDTAAGQQVLHIPLRALLAHVNEQSLSETQTQSQPPRHHEFVKEAPLGSPAPPQYIDYLIDGPRQSLDEEQQQQQQHQHEASQAAPPQLQHAYILVTTTAPHTDHQPAGANLQRHPEISTPRPAVIYKQQPTLRLQPVHTYKATRRPVYVTTPAPTPSHTVEITPKYVYVSSNANKAVAPAPPPSPSREPSTVTPIKLKPVYKYAHERPPLTPAVQGHTAVYDDQLPDIRTSSLAEILHKLQASNHLPHTLTPDNIDNSIKTLIRILQNLKQTQTIASSPPQHHETKHSGASHEDYDYNTDSGEDHATATTADKGPNKHPGPSTGRAGIDYPNYSVIPQTSFECTKQRYKGFFGDPETNCQVWHYCDLNGGKASFLCPNGTIFSQIALTCDWWFNVKCSTTAQLYVLNERLYKYILPFNPKFPEDYNGPIVDKYLAMKFQEMEEKMRQEKQRKTNEQAEKPVEVAPSTPALPKNHKPSPKHGSGINAQVYEQSSERNLLIDDEIDDISERGSYDTYDQAPTTVMSPSSTQDTQQSFVLRPIVVSSTPQPEADFDVEPTALLQGSEEQEQEQEDKLQSLRDTKAAEQKQSTTRVSVQKLEVIEIKTDGDTGQLMPIKGTGE